MCSGTCAKSLKPPFLKEKKKQKTSFMNFTKSCEYDLRRSARLRHYAAIILCSVLPEWAWSRELMWVRADCGGESALITPATAGTAETFHLCL